MSVMSNYVCTMYRVSPIKRGQLIFLLVTSERLYTSSSAVAKRPRDASCLSVVSFNSTITQAQFFYYYTVGQKNGPLYFSNNFVKPHYILIIFGTQIL